MIAWQSATWQRACRNSFDWPRDLRTPSARSKIRPPPATFSRYALAAPSVGLKVRSFRAAPLAVARTSFSAQRYSQQIVASAGQREVRSFSRKLIRFDQSIFSRVPARLPRKLRNDTLSTFAMPLLAPASLGLLSAPINNGKYLNVAVAAATWPIFGLTQCGAPRIRLPGNANTAKSIAVRSATYQLPD